MIITAKSKYYNENLMQILIKYEKYYPSAKLAADFLFEFNDYNGDISQIYIKVLVDYFSKKKWFNSFSSISYLKNYLNYKSAIFDHLYDLKHNYYVKEKTVNQKFLDSSYDELNNFIQDYSESFFDDLNVSFYLPDYILYEDMELIDDDVSLLHDYDFFYLGNQSEKTRADVNFYEKNYVAFIDFPSKIELNFGDDLIKILEFYKIKRKKLKGKNLVVFDDLIFNLFIIATYGGFYWSKDNNMMDNNFLKLISNEDFLSYVVGCSYVQEKRHVCYRHVLFLKKFFLKAEKLFE